MTPCYRVELPLRTVVVEYDRTGPWHSRWALSLYRPDDTRAELRRYASYTEARRAAARLSFTHEKESIR